MKKVKKLLPLLILSPALLIVSLNNDSSSGKDFSVYKKPIYFKTCVKPTDPYYTGSSKVTDYRGDRVYQNISMKFLGDIETIWDSYTGKGVTVAVIDTGIDINHPDFADKLSNKSGKFTVSSQNIGLSYAKHSSGDSSHGTNTAGCVGAAMNGEGTVGIAPDAEIMVLKVDLTDVAINKAIRYAADNGAQVINLSLGGHSEPYYSEDGTYHDKEDDYSPGSDTSMVASLKYAHDKGCIIVAAAGNEDTSSYSYPAANKYVIGVGALEYKLSDKQASFSNFNKDTDTAGSNCNVDVVAPGYVVTTNYDHTLSGYCQTQGTSFSSPIVAGAAALWKEKYPNGSPEKFESDLFTSVDDIGNKGWDIRFGYGRLNIYSLLVNFDIDVSEVKLYPGRSYKLKITKPKSCPEVTFASGDTAIATVSEDGTITAVGIGTTTITATCDGVTKTVNVIVEKKQEMIIGCGGNIQSTSTLISLLSFAFVTIILIKKKAYK